MGVSRSTRELVAKIEDTAGMAGKKNKTAIGKAASTFKRVGLQMVADELGSDLAFSNWRGPGRPLKLGIGYTVTGERDAKAIIQPRPMPRGAKTSGPWMMMEFGRNAYTIVPKPKRVRAQTRRKGARTKRVGGNRRLVYPPALKMPWGQFVYRVQVPAQPAKRLWSRIGNRAARPAWDRYQLQMARELRQRFE